MDTARDEDPTSPYNPGSKAGRNERRKLFAALLNNLAAASIIAALLQPALALIRKEGSGGIDDYAAALVFCVIGLTLHAVGQIVVTGLED